MGKAATKRAALGQSQVRGRTRPDSDQPATRWDNRPAEVEPTTKNLFAMWRRHRPKPVEIVPGVRAERKARQRRKRLDARARALANGKRAAQ